jgi:hypothetical protein
VQIGRGLCLKVMRYRVGLGWVSLITIFAYVSLMRSSFDVVNDHENRHMIFASSVPPADCPGILDRIKTKSMTVKF